MPFLSALTVLVHYKAFDTNVIFQFTGSPLNVDLADMQKSDLLECIFEECNHNFGTNWIAGREIRSMSTGDEVILINHKNNTVTRHMVALMGFVDVPNG